MKELVLGLFKTGSDIRDFANERLRLIDQKTRRSLVKIAAIDDAPFAAQTNLQSYGYQITPIGDVKDLDEVRDYNIILCDLMGVGLHFDGKNQGASLIAEIKQRYPEKVVIAYTGASMASSVSKSASARADTILRKDIHIEEWTSSLDEFVNESIDPYIIWSKIRSRLVDLDTDTKTILQLEDAFVRSVLSKDSSFSQVKGVLKSSAIASDVRAIIQSLIASLIFKALFGS